LTRAGARSIVPATSTPCESAAEEETIIQVYGTGPTDITFVNAAADPRKK